MEKATENKNKPEWKTIPSKKEGDALVGYKGYVKDDGQPHGFGKRVIIKKSTTDDKKIIITTERGIFENNELVHGVIETKDGTTKKIEAKIKNPIELNNYIVSEYNNYTVQCNRKAVNFAGFIDIRDGMKFIRCVAYDEHGNKAEEGEFINDKLVRGIAYKNGSKAEEGQFKDRHIVIGAVYVDGKKNSEGEFKKNGNLVIGAVYVDGKKNREGEFIDDKLVRGICYHTNGNKFMEGEFINDKLVRGIAYYMNGKKMREGEFDKDGLIARGFSYDINGEKMREGEFKKGLLARGVTYEGKDVINQGELNMVRKAITNAESAVNRAKNICDEIANTSLKKARSAVNQAKNICDEITKDSENGWPRITIQQREEYNIDDGKSIAATSVVPQSEINDGVKSTLDFTDVANHRDFEGLIPKQTVFNINQEASSFANNPIEKTEEDEERKSNAHIMIAEKPFIRNTSHGKRKLSLSFGQKDILDLSRASSVNKSINLVNISKDSSISKPQEIKHFSNGSNFEKIKTQRGLSMYTQRDNIKSRKASVYDDEGQKLKISEKVEDSLRNHDYKRATRSISQSISAAKNVANGPKDVSQERISSWKTWYKKKEANKNNTKESMLL